MKPQVNLSSTPFRNRRLFWLAILLLFLIPAYFGLQAIGSAARVNAELSLQEMKTKAVEDKLIKIDRPVVSNTKVSYEENKQLVAASELIARRAFSWSQLLNYIEQNLPAGVRVLRVSVTQIQPREREESFDGTENAATLGLIVIGKNGQDVTTMINRMHESGRFKVFPMSRKSVEGTDEIEFELKVEYFPPNTANRANQNNRVAEAKSDEVKAAKAKSESQIAKKTTERK
ncbi:MAG TPA: hypothetical protein VGB07_35295 [Blastocatellia bacterium]|jgi:hypothetical protein